MRKLRLAAAALAVVVTGCTPVGGVMLAADVIKAAAIAAAEHAEKEQDAAFERELALGLDFYVMRSRAERGDAQAQYWMGLHYEGRKNPAARRWVCLAANQNHPPAQLLLGHWYNESRLHADLWPHIGITPDNRLAYMWYSLAGHNGDHFAEVFLRETASALEGERLEDAQALVSGWHPQECRSAAATSSVQPSAAAAAPAPTAAR